MKSNAEHAKAAQLLHDVLCRIRYFAGREINDQCKAELCELADAAHNIPLAFTDDPRYKETLAGDMERLESILREPVDISARLKSESSESTDAKLVIVVVVVSLILFTLAMAHT